jgi:acyl dehydratase
LAVNKELIGKRHPPHSYEVGREKIREYARAVGESNPIYQETEAARGAGFANVVAPPMFCVVYCGPALGPALFDPQLGIDFAHLVHGGQEFEWGPLVVAGDEITTTLSVKDISSRGPLGFFTFETVSVNQDGHTVCVGTWTNIVRGL